MEEPEQGTPRKSRVDSPRGDGLARKPAAPPAPEEEDEVEDFEFSCTRGSCASACYRGSVDSRTSTGSRVSSIRKIVSFNIPGGRAQGITQMASHVRNFGAKVGSRVLPLPAFAKQSSASRNEPASSISRSSTWKLTTRVVETMRGTLSRGQASTVHHSALTINPFGGMMRENRAIDQNQWLTEIVPDEEQRKVLLPFGRFRTIWDTVVLLLVLYTAVVLPIDLTFKSVASTYPQALTDWETASDFIFLLDVCFNFRTAYIDVHAQRLVVEPKRIARRYVRGWFCVDIVASLPLDALFRIVESGASHVSVTQALKVLKVPKLLRVGRFIKAVDKMSGDVNVGQIGLLCLVLVILVHWITCAFYGVTVSVRDADPNSGWLTAQPFADSPWYEQYLPTYYTALMMVMGDTIEIGAQAEFAFASVVVVLGACINATIFASIASYVAQVGAVSAAHKRRMSSINRSLRGLQDSGLQASLANRIRTYFEYTWSRHRDFSAQNLLLHDMPTIFRKRIAMQVHQEKLRRFPPFAEVEERFIGSLAQYLSPEVFMPEEYVLVAGHVSQSTYFIDSGHVQVTWQANEPGYVNVLKINDYFNEFGLFVNQKLVYTVSAVTHLDVFRLDRSDFEQVMKSHPVGAIWVADQINGLLPPELARRVIEEIYGYAGLREVLQTIALRWRPPKGLAARLIALSKDEAIIRALLRLRQKAAGGLAEHSISSDHSGHGRVSTPRRLTGRSEGSERLEGSEQSHSRTQPPRSPGGEGDDGASASEHHSPPEPQQRPRPMRDGGTTFFASRNASMSPRNISAAEPLGIFDMADPDASSPPDARVSQRCSQRGIPYDEPAFPNLRAARARASRASRASLTGSGSAAADISRALESPPAWAQRQQQHADTLTRELGEVKAMLQQLLDAKIVV